MESRLMATSPARALHADSNLMARDRPAVGRLYCIGGRHFPEYVRGCVLSVQDAPVCDNHGNCIGFWEAGKFAVPNDIQRQVKETGTFVCIDSECPGQNDECEYRYDVTDAEADALSEPQDEDEDSWMWELDSTSSEPRFIH